MHSLRKSTKKVIGQVVSNKMDKTITVLFTTNVKHSLYEKYIKRSTKLMAHDANNECEEGDIVIIQSSRPQSKKKSWQLKEIVTKKPST